TSSSRRSPAAVPASSPARSGSRATRCERPTGSPPHSPRGERDPSPWAASPDGASASPPGSVSTRPSCAASTSSAARAADGGRELAPSRFTVEPAFEVTGHGRAAAALVANCDPYTYAGQIPLHIAPLARFELGLDLVAPTRVTASRLPRLASYAVRGKGQESARDVLYEHDADRIEIVCDRPLPLQVDGEDLGDVDHAVFEAERGAVQVAAA